MAPLLAPAPESAGPAGQNPGRRLDAARMSNRAPHPERELAHGVDDLLSREAEALLLKAQGADDFEARRDAESQLQHLAVLGDSGSHKEKQ